MIKIVTDTDSNMPQDVIDEYGIELAPIHIIFGDEIVREHFEITPAEAYQRILAAPEFPTTSQPPVGEFKVIYEKLLAEDPQATILSLHISNKMSGTIDSARQAAAMLPEADIRIFDTLSASLGQAFMVRQAAEMARQGADIDAIMAYMAVMRDKTQAYFAVKSLECLARGGRIGKASHLMANMLDIKPILKVDDGVIDSHSKFRTWKRATAGLREYVSSQVPKRADRSPDEVLHMGIAHAVSEAEALEAMTEFKEALEPDVMLMSEVGPGLGVHVGPGALAVLWALVPAP